MYPRLIRPLLFLFPPEWIHRAVAAIMPVFFSIPGMAPLFRRHYLVRDPALGRTVFGIHFPNPVGIAAGFDKKATLYNALSCFGFGHIEIGTVTPLSQEGNPRPRLFRLPKDKALINRMGFNNQGIEAFVKNLKKKQPKVIIGGNIGKNTLTPNEQAADDYCLCFEKLFDLVDYFVVNVSCPNIKDLNKLQDRPALTAILKALQEINQDKPMAKPILLKVSPDLDHAQLDEVMEIVYETKLDGIVATNTSTQRDSLSSSPATLEKIGQGGLSGKPLNEKATNVIAYIHRKSGGTIPIIGVGGIFGPGDALKKIRAGASLVQVYTGLVYSGPSIAKKINHAIRHEH